MQKLQSLSDRLILGLGILLVLTLLFACWAIFQARARFQERNTLPTPEPTVLVTATPASVATPTLAELPPLTTADIDVPYLATPPQLDGVLDEWQGKRPFSATFITEQQTTWDGSLDVDNRWWLGWDENALYLAVAVIDDQHVQTQPAQFAYRGDSLELQFDTQLTADQGQTLANTDDLQFVLSPGDFATLPAGFWRFRGDAENQMFSDYTGGTVQVVSRQQTGGYTLEARIPWADLAVTPSANQTMGAAFSINDNDTPNTAKQELMLSHVASRLWIDPTSWGTITLLAP